jgi:hypothetical protein
MHINSYGELDVPEKELIFISFMILLIQERKREEATESGVTSTSVFAQNYVIYIYIHNGKFSQGIFSVTE